MKVMVLVKATSDSEAARMPTTEELTAMGTFNEQLVAAGVMVDGDGLRPSSFGKRVRFDGDRRDVVDGPFDGDVVAGYWIWQVGSVDEAVDWLKKAPFDGGQEVEVRPMVEPEDFGEAFTPELREAEERMRAHVSARG